MEVTFTPSEDIINVGIYPIKVKYSSNFNDNHIIQCSYPYTWGHEIDFHNRNEEEIKSLNNSTVAIWHIKKHIPT